MNTFFFIAGLSVILFGVVAFLLQLLKGLGEKEKIYKDHEHKTN